MNKLFDSHAHYDDEKFDIPEGFDSREALINSIFDGNISKILNAGTNLLTSRYSIELSKQYDGFYAACGIHPSDCTKYDDIDSVLKEIEVMLSNPKAVAIGEIGLDYHYDFSPKEKQLIWFERQLMLAQKTGYPVIIHDREAHGDVFDMLKKYPTVRGIIHSCSESFETVRELVKMGYYISFSGTLTFKNAARLPESVKAVPLDRILIETDCPYLAPHPYRGKMNHSGYVQYTAQKIAEIKDTSYDDICRITYENACRIFGIKEDAK